MKATIIECAFGILAFSEENALVEKVLFSKNPQNAAKTITKIESGKIVDEVASLIELLKKKGYNKFVFENASLAKEAEKLGITTEIAKPSRAGELVRSNMERFAVETGFVKNAEEFNVWTHNVTMEIAKLRVKGAVEKRDLIIAQAIQTLDDLDKTINLFMSRVREWYGIHFPELDRLIDKHETYARLILELGNRENFTVEALEKHDMSKSKAGQIAKTAEASMGADLAEADLKQIQTLCKDVLNLYQLRENMEKYLETAMEEVAPNVKAIVGALLGARLIAISGGLTNLARRPASTIQVLGAEKALFRSLKSGARPPKHGIIFQHTYLHEAKKWQRGKIARALAGKLAIAARSDAFGGRYIGDDLKADLEKRLEEIREKYTEPPQIPEKKPQQEKKWRKNKRARKR
ncbi:MAG: C/D box methylation guide ribonucleoprotein complex aNOP56 subunit [Candidatus Bathyarchaeota archaeon]|jgi:nucleolar protein 56|nr:C/D box methylation guide ribonucleoprotein complex aNOP56 subunit [Candidatus Bathyarchaeota archaeon A05DMB-5]MDH7558463.1 C/D box methylation guide ribonucleoprotein complex aNOP56 subunit [Candidatus Bathyarchaeota archaeon]